MGVVVGGLVVGLLVGYLHVFVLGYMTLFVSHGGYKYFGAWAFLLNGTASAFVTAFVVGIPLGYLLPRRAITLALVVGAGAAVLLVCLGILTASARWWWVPVMDALQLFVFLLGATWLGLRLPTYRELRT
jgi:hypothetical protein